MKHILRIETLIHLVMITFAVASVFNIGEYLVQSHNVITSYALASSLGFGLVAISIILSKIGTSDRSLFAKLLVATIAVCLLSGTLQTLAYHQHLGSWALAALFGYGFPLVAEVILALAISAYDQDQLLKKIRSAKEQLRNKSALVLTETVERYDSGEIQRHVDEQISQIVKDEVDDVLREMGKKGAEPSVSKPPLPSSKRTVDRSGKLETFLSHLEENYGGTPTDQLNKSLIAKELGISHMTVGRRIAELHDTGKLNGTVPHRAG